MTTENLLVFSICFLVGGWGIPLHAPSILFDKWFSFKERALYGVGLSVWAICLSYTVTYFVSRLA